MAQTGSLGDINFEVSSDKVFTWRGYRRKHRARFAAHDVAEGLQKLEFTGVELKELDLEIHLDAAWVNPEAEIKALQDILEAGEPQVLMIGSSPQGEYCLEDMTETRTHTDGQGKTVKARVKLKLREYN